MLQVWACKVGGTSLLSSVCLAVVITLGEYYGLLPSAALFWLGRVANALFIVGMIGGVVLWPWALRDILGKRRTRAPTTTVAFMILLSCAFSLAPYFFYLESTSRSSPGNRRRPTQSAD